ncbi:MAG: EAL domain-containing protein [Gammaproteobacteria bacterium]|nr:EAL domain-containing protein [Gammaproteobacteria bacterium]
MSDLNITYTVVLAMLVAGAGFWFIINRNREYIEQKQENTGSSQLHTLIEGTIGTTGESFFYALARELAHYLQVDSIIIASCEEAGSHNYRTHAYWCDDGYVMNQSISLADCPAGSAGGFWNLQNSASDMFPQSDLFQSRFRVAGFFSMHLQDSSGNKIGLLAGMHRNSFHPDNQQIDIIKLFCARASAELERCLAISETLLEKDRAQITLHSIGDGVITTDSSGAIDYMNPVAERLTGWRFHQAMGMSMESILHLEDEVSGRIIPDPAQHCLSERRIISPKTENVLISRNGTRYSIQGTAAPMFGLQGNCLGVVLVFKDVTDSRRKQKMIVHQATHDPLTGLVNRAEFEVRLEKSLESAQNFENTHALLYLDLDQFKIVNDTAGHVAGDELLKQISALLSSQLRGRDTLGRLGGDEFSVLLENCPLSKASRVAEILIDSIREYRFIWEEKTYQLGVSIGVVAITSESSDRVELMNRADQACYTAKDLGRGCAYVATDDSMPSNLPQVEKIGREDIAYAIENERFHLLYQPVIELNTEKRGGFIRAEVLLRMIDLENNDLKPGAFIPSASRYGMMAQVDRWVITRLFKDYSHIFMQNPDLIMSVNLSAQVISDDQLIEFVSDQFNKNVLSPKQICFEIAETTLTNHFSKASRFIEEMCKIGCSIALDDFGSGLSSFSYLKNIKVDFVKIDGDLIRDVGIDIIDKAMVESINTMCHLLDIRTIAKCADSDLVVSEIKQLGIDFAQGYYLGNPVSMDKFTHMKSEGISRPRALIN